MKLLVPVLLSALLLSAPVWAEKTPSPTAPPPPPTEIQKLAALSAEFYATLSQAQQAQADSGEEVQLFNDQLAESQRKIALSWLQQRSIIKSTPEETRAAIAAGQLDIIDGVGIIGRPPSIRIWTKPYHFDRMSPVEKNPEDLPALLRRELLLKRNLFRALSAEQKLKARPEGDGGDQGLFADRGGLRFADLTPTQQALLQELAANNREQSEFMQRDDRPGKPETFRVFYWEDKKTGIPGGEISFGSFGKDCGALEIGGRVVAQARAGQLQKAKTLFDGLTKVQLEKAQADGLNYAELKAEQQALFWSIAETGALLWGREQALHKAAKADWQLTYQPELASPDGKETRPVLAVQLGEFQDRLPADGKPSLQEALMLGKRDYLPLAAEQLIGEIYPQWSLIENLEFEPGLVEMVYADFGETAGPQWIKGDFNGDGQADYAVLLRQENKLMLLALQQLPGGRWQPYELTQVPAGGAKELNSFITRAAPGEIAYWPPQGTEKTGRLQLQHDGIILHYAGQTSQMFYWTGMPFAKVQTAD